MRGANVSSADIETLTDQEPFELAGRRVEPATLRVSRGGDMVRLEPKAMQVLVYLASRPGEVVTRRDLDEHLWRGRFITEDAVTNAIIKLRRALRGEARRPEIVETIPKTGYRLIGPVAPAVAVGGTPEKGPSSCWAWPCSSLSER